MTFVAITEASRRLALLRFLDQMSGQANESVIRDALRALGFSGRQLGDTRNDICFLGARDLVASTFATDTLMVVRLTARGAAYLAREIEPIEGVKYPSIGG